MNMRARIWLLAWSFPLLPVATRADDLTGADQQNKDEAECYNWAVSNIVTDPFDLTKQAQATEQIELQSGLAQQATQTQIENFKKAFSVCLEAKEYMVRF